MQLVRVVYPKRNHSYLFPFLPDSSVLVKALDRLWQKTKRTPQREFGEQQDVNLCLEDRRARPSSQEQPDRRTAVGRRKGHHTLSFVPAEIFLTLCLWKIHSLDLIFLRFDDKIWWSKISPKSVVLHNQVIKVYCPNHSA